MPVILLELEESQDSSICLPPFRYVGSALLLPPGCGMPYCLLELRSSATEVKDRVIQNEVFSLTITLVLSESWLYPLYYAAIKECLKSLALENIHVRTIRKIYPDTMELFLIL
jgi:hypothetical protein